MSQRIETRGGGDSLTRTKAKPRTASEKSAMRVGMFEIDGQKLRVGIREGTDARPPLLMFNGIGANL